MQRVRIPVYEIRLRAGRSLRLAESSLSNADRAARALHDLIGLTDREHFAVLFLDALQAITGAHVVAIGAQSRMTAIEVRTVFRGAIAACAAGLVLGHNHPSGDPTPSQDDASTTLHLRKAGECLGIPVVDHVIVTRNPRRFHSMLSNGPWPEVNRTALASV